MVEGRHRDLVGLALEGVEILVETRLGRPVPERDADLVGRVTARHPVRLLDADDVEEKLERRRRPFTDTDDADVGRLHERDLDVLICPVGRHQVGGDPAGGAAAEDYDALGAFTHN